MNTREFLAHRRAQLLKSLTPEERAELDEVYRALNAIDNAGMSTSLAPGRPPRPIDEIRAILSENGDFMEWEDIKNVLMSGGAGEQGTRRAKINDYSVAYKLALFYKTLVQDGRKRIGLPEWKGRK